MIVVANIQVGNEVELLDKHIEYHLNLGIDAFVIVDIFSRDGTREILKKYQHDPRFRIRYVDQEEVITPSGIKTGEIGAWMVDIGKGQFKADWIIRMDADEFIYPKDGDLKSILRSTTADVLSIERCNVIFPARHIKVELPVVWSDFLDHYVVAKPYPTAYTQYGIDDSHPLILSRVGSKTILRASQVSGLNPGGHAAINIAGETLSATVGNNIRSFHFWFTTPTRFKIKTSTICRFEKQMRQQLGPSAWEKTYWYHWCLLAKQGTNSVVEEFDRQFLPRDEFQKHLDDGGIVKASTIFELT